MIYNNSIEILNINAPKTENKQQQIITAIGQTSDLGLNSVTVDHCL
jgi:hypothetical protein